MSVSEGSQNGSLDRTRSVHAVGRHIAELMRIARHLVETL
jgi:hypothetical protein